MKKLLFFHQANCPPCDLAKPKIATLEAAGFEVEHVDVTPEAGFERAMTYKVRMTPTAVVVDEEGKRVAGFVAGLINVDTLSRVLQS